MAAPWRSFSGDPAAVRALIRGLSSFDFEEAVLSAYDAMRGAGVRVEDLAASRRPRHAEDELAAMLRELRADRSPTGATSRSSTLERRMERASRIVLTRPGRCERCRPSRTFACNLQKCKRGTAPTSL